MINKISKNSSVNDYLKYLTEKERLQKIKERLDKKVELRAELLAGALNLRYEFAIEEETTLADYEINSSLNLVLGSLIINNRAVIHIPNEGIENKCITRSYGYKSYKCWGSDSLDLKKCSLTKDYKIRKTYNSDQSYFLDFSILVDHKDVDQKNLKYYFKFLKRSIALAKFYDIKIENLTTKTGDVSDLKEKMHSWTNNESIEEKIRALPKLDSLYSLYLINSKEFKERQDQLLTDLNEYNKPFKLLTQLQS